MTSAFDRTRCWLADFGDPDALAAALAGAHVELVVEEARPDAEISAALAASMLLRLDQAAPILHVVAPRARARRLPRLADLPLAQALALEHRGFDSVTRLSAAPAGDAVIRIRFGTKSPGALSVTSSGWQVAIGDPPLPGDGNPIAAAYAGVLAAVEAIKAMLTAVGLTDRQLRPWTGTVSLWDYEHPGATGPRIPARLNLDGVGFAGCGGIASTTGWTLALLDLAGAPHAIDNDALDTTNLNRHLTAGHPEAEATMLKVDAFAAMLDVAGATTIRHPKRWQQLPAQARAAFDLVVVTVDDDATRHDVQLDLPRRILNAGNADTGVYRVTSHDFLNGACLRCISRAHTRASGPEESAAHRLGLTLADVNPHLLTNEPLPTELLGRATMTNAERERLTGVPARSALGIVCGEFSALPAIPALSMPPLSAAPGVLLAAEIVKDRIGASTALNGRRNVLSAGILRGPHDRWLSHRAKQPGCECGDPTYRTAYTRRHPRPA
jgi:hypothetical protein